MSPATVYTINIGRETVWAGTDLDAAQAWALTRANEAQAAYPNAATPHLVIQVWQDGETAWTDDVHIYATGSKMSVALDDDVVLECANDECAERATVVGSVGTGAYRTIGVPLCDLHAAAEGHRFTRTASL